MKLHHQITTNYQAHACTKYLETYSGFRSITNYEGDEVDLDDGVGADVEDDGDADGDTPPTPRRSW